MTSKFVSPQISKQVAEYLKTTTPDAIRKDVYEAAKAGQLSTALIILLVEVRRQENATKKGNKTD